MQRIDTDYPFISARSAPFAVYSPFAENGTDAETGAVIRAENYAEPCVEPSTYLRAVACAEKIALVQINLQ